MSSANALIARSWLFPICIPSALQRNYLTTDFNAVLNKTGDKMSPCLKPEDSQNLFDQAPLKLTLHLESSTHVLVILTSFS